MNENNDSNSIRVSGWRANVEREKIDSIIDILKGIGTSKAHYVNYQQCYIDFHYASAEQANSACREIEQRNIMLSDCIVKCQILPGRSAIRKQEQETKMNKLIDEMNEAEQKDMLLSLRLMIQMHPDDSKSLLLQHPELVYAVNQIRKKQNQ